MNPEFSWPTKDISALKMPEYQSKVAENSSKIEGMRYKEELFVKLALWYTQRLVRHKIRFIQHQLSNEFVWVKSLFKIKLSFSLSPFYLSANSLQDVNNHDPGFLSFVVLSNTYELFLSL